MHLYGKKRFSNTHVFEHMFFLCKAMPFRLHINFYYHRVCKRNIIYNWKQLSFKFLYKWWVSGFCKLWNRSQMGFSYWWSICNNFTWTYFNLWQEYLCLICHVRESARERKKERERHTHTERQADREKERETKTETETEKGNYLIEENFNRKSFEFSWDFVAFSLWNVSLNKTFYPRRKTLPAKNIAKQTLFRTIFKSL